MLVEVVYNTLHSITSLVKPVMLKNRDCSSLGSRIPFEDINNVLLNFNFDHKYVSNVKLAIGIKVIFEAIGRLSPNMGNLNTISNIILRFRDKASLLTLHSDWHNAPEFLNFSQDSFLNLSPREREEKAQTACENFLRELKEKEREARHRKDKKPAKRPLCKGDKNSKR